MLDADSVPADADCAELGLESDVAKVVAVDVIVIPLEGPEVEVAVAVAFVTFGNPLRIMELPPLRVAGQDRTAFSSNQVHTCGSTDRGQSHIG